jgi:hypothetical protein
LTFSFPQGGGFYEFYTIAIDGAGNREIAPTSADATTQRLSGDTTPPTSAAGALPATTTANSINVPYTASDNASGVASVEVWVRYRANAAQAWGTWAKGPTGTSSPVTYTFASGDGIYEFYTIAVDGAGNRELAPAVADSSTTRDAVDDPPGQSFSGDLRGTLDCSPHGCVANYTLRGSGSGADDRTNVTAIDYRIYGVTSSGVVTRLANWKTATATDGSFNSKTEPFTITYGAGTSPYYRYQVEIRVTAGTQTSTVIYVV